MCEHNMLNETMTRLLWGRARRRLPDPRPRIGCCPVLPMNIVWSGISPTSLSVAVPRQATCQVAFDAAALNVEVACNY
jgi:hypothetical protein